MHSLRFSLTDESLRRRAGLILLAISFLIGFYTLQASQFSDEADNLVLGSLLARGLIPYRDTFSHHFPFAYYWTAAVFEFFGDSVLAARVSLHLFQVASVLIAMRLSGFYLGLGMAALVWSLLRPLYLGHLVLYSSFAGPALLVVLAIVLAIVLEKAVPGRAHWLAVGIFALIALLSTPLAAAAVAVALVAMIGASRVFGIKAAIVVAAGLALFGLLLWASDTLVPFWEDAIRFNSEVYGRYINADTFPVKPFLRQALTGLEITDPAWRQLDPLRAIKPEYSWVDRWVFTGFLYRFAALAATFSLIARRRYQAAVFMYLFLAGTLVIERWDFRAQPFVLAALFALAGVATQEWGQAKRRWVAAVDSGIGLALAVMVAWLGIRGAQAIYSNRNAYSLTGQFAGLRAEAERIKALSCGIDGVKLAQFPEGSYRFLFTGMEPVGGYTYLWPWVAETELDHTIEALSEDDLLAVVVRNNQVIWGHWDTREYLKPLDDLLARDYVQVGEGVYESPELARQCALKR